MVMYMGLCQESTWEPGGYKGKDRSTVDERDKETNWNSFLTKFSLASESQAPIFFKLHEYTPIKTKSLFCLVKKKKNLAKLKGLEKINWFENINWF